MNLKDTPETLASKVVNKYRQAIEGMVPHQTLLEQEITAAIKAQKREADAATDALYMAAKEVAEEAADPGEGIEDIIPSNFIDDLRRAIIDYEKESR